MNKPRKLVVFDEAQDLIGKELSQVTGSGYISPYDALFRKGRAFRIGILAGLQNLMAISDEAKANSAVHIVFRCPDPAGAAEAARMINLSHDQIHEIQNLPGCIAFVNGWGVFGPINIQIPNPNE